MAGNNDDFVYVHQSFLDTDLYKLTMQQAICNHFPNARGAFKFTHRDTDILFSRKCIDQFRKSVQRFRDIRLTNEEKGWLARTCPYFSNEYLHFLAQLRFDPAQVTIKFIPISEDGERGRVEIEANGLWKETTLWEVPLMACLSEVYFRVDATDWSYEGQKENAIAKARALLQGGCAFSEFGTRRRRSFYTQDLVISAFKEEAVRSSGPGVLVGTSNPYFAMKYNLRAVGTIAHEWFMGVSASKGYENANTRALELWSQTYPNDLFVALTDTFSTRVFFQEFAKDPVRAQRWTALRQDSGNPFDFAPAAKAMYESIGIDVRTKTILYSDSLNVDRALKLRSHCDEIGFKSSFGIGTSFTNDFKTKSSGYTAKSRALNMVIKLAQVDDKHCVKISDDLTKNTGEKDAVEYVKKFYGLIN